MKKFLLLAACALFGMTANAQLSKTYSSTSTWEVTLGDAVTSLSNLADGTYVMYNEMQGSSAYLLDPNSTTGNYTYTTATTPSIYNVVKVAATTTTGAYTIETYSGFINLTSATNGSAVAVSATSDNLYFTASNGVSMKNGTKDGTTSTAGSTMIYNIDKIGDDGTSGTYSETYASASPNKILGSTLSAAPQNVISRGNGYKANLSTAVHFVKVTVTEKTNFYSDLKAAVDAYFTTNVGSYFAMSKTYYDANHETYEGYVSAESCAKDQYETMAAAVKADVAANVPADGYYFIKNNLTNAYITYGVGGLAATKTPVYNSVLYLKKGDNGYSIHVVDSICAAGTGTAGEAIKYGTDEVYQVIEIGDKATPGVVRISASGHSEALKYWNHQESSNTVVGWYGGKDNDGSYWVVVPAADSAFSANLSSKMPYASLYVPFPCTISGESSEKKITVNYVSEVSAPSTDEASGKEKNGEATLEKFTGTVLPAGTPVILSGDEKEQEFTVTVASEAGTTVSDNKLAGTYVQMEDSEKGNYYLNYVTNGDGVTPGFYKLKSGSKASANKAYLPYSTVNTNVRGFNFVSEGETTGINQVTGHGSQVTNIYDLQGRRVNALGNGVFIVNGHKYVK